MLGSTPEIACTGKLQWPDFAIYCNLVTIFTYSTWTSVSPPSICINKEGQQRLG